jgi:Tfp pilus assembly protein PilO
MARRNKKEFNAKSMRMILLVLVCAAILGIGGGLYYSHDQLTTQAKEVNSTLVRLANTGAVSQPSGAIQQLQADMDSYKGTVDKLNLFWIPSANLQTQTIQDINRYSRESGVAIENYTFGPTADNDSLQANDVTVILKNPVNYDGLIRFMQLIETNLPKMQLHGISIASTGDGQSVTVSNLVIGVSAR